MNINKKSAPLQAEGLWTKDLDLDAGAFEYAAKEGKSLSMFLEEHRYNKGDGTDAYVGLTKSEVMNVQKAMRAAGEAPPLTALEETLKILGIQVSGAYSDKIEKFYEARGADIIFGEYWSDMIYAGMLKTPYVSEFVFDTIQIDADNYHKVYLETLEQNRQLKRVSEFEDFPEIKILVAAQEVKLQSFGAYITMSYKALKEQRVNAFAKTLERIGLQIEIDRFDDLVTTARLGDGNSNTPGTTVSTATSGTIGTGDVIAWATALPTPYKLDKFAGKKALIQEYLTTLSDFDNPIATWGFMGVDLPRYFEWDRTSITSDVFVGVDSRYAIQHITNGPPLIETEKVIRKQFEGTAISHSDCFTIFDNDAIALFDETH